MANLTVSASTMRCSSGRAFAHWKMGRPMPPEQALIAVEHFQTYLVAPITNDLINKGIRRSIDAKISFWDGLIVETALAERADLLVTEDLRDGWQIGSIRVWNSFRH